MEILKALQKLLKIKPNIENLKENRDVDELIEAFSYYSSGAQADLRFRGEIAIVLGELGDIRAIPIIEKELNDLDSVEGVWQDMRQNLPLAFRMEKTQEDYKKDMDTISFIRPRATQALKILHLVQHGEESGTKKQKLLQAIALLWELRARRKNETTAQADPSFWAFLDESHLEMELQQGLATLNDHERAKIQAVLNGKVIPISETESVSKIQNTAKLESIDLVGKTLVVELSLPTGQSTDAALQDLKTTVLAQQQGMGHSSDIVLASLLKTAPPKTVFIVDNAQSVIEADDSVVTIIAKLTSMADRDERAIRDVLGEAVWEPQKGDPFFDALCRQPADCYGRWSNHSKTERGVILRHANYR